MDHAPATPLTDTAMERFRAAVEAELGPDVILAEPDRVAPYLRELRDLYQGEAPFVLRPRTTDDVSAVMRLAADHALAVVPQGGNTGLVGGQTPFAGEVVISTERLDTIEEVDRDGNTMLVGAGAVLASVQEAAEAAGRLFPVSLASQGSARIGGLIATNAGGTGVLAYGNMRDSVLGLEVVLADGRVWNGLRALRKDNTGYDLKHLFIGSEGTLGIITRAVLATVQKPLTTDVALAGVASPAAAVALLSAVRGALGSGLTGFELVPRIGIDMVLRHGHGVRNPFNDGVPDWVVLIEASTFSADRPLRETLENALMTAFENGEVTDAVVSQSLTEAQDFWRLREQLSEVQRQEGGSIKHDVSVPVNAVPRFIAEATEAALSVVPDARPVPFGHVGDGNIHFNISQPVDADKAAFLARWDAVAEAVHAVVRRYEGSIAAEHGVGRMKQKLLSTVRSDVEQDMMRAIKNALDPQGRMSPGRVLPESG